MLGKIEHNMVSITERIKNYKKQISNYKIDKKIKNFNEDCKKLKKYSDFSKHIIISGEPRGGTTWLMEILMNKSDCLIWEPLHHKHLKDYSENFYNQIGQIPYIPENEKWAMGEKFFNQLLNGQLPYGLPINFQYNTKFEKSDGLLIKFCRANMLLPWINKNFPETKPIYLLRHPLSVISSQLRHSAFKDVGTIYQLFKIREAQNPAFSDIFNTHKDKINKIKSKESMYANWWAIQNLLALNTDDRNWLTVSYESLYLKPMFELERISNHLNIEMSRFSFDKITQPSYTTQPGSGILEQKNQLSNFKRHLTKDQIKEILDIIHSYGIDCYSDKLEPEYEKLEY